MNKQREIRQWRREQREAYQRWEKMMLEEKAEQERLQRQHQKESEFVPPVFKMEMPETKNDVIVLSEIEPGRFAATLREEVESALLFGRLLRLENLLVEGTTARQLLKRVFETWRAEGSWCVNYHTGKFSENYRSTKTTTFEESWKQTSDEDFDAPLNSEDYKETKN